MCPHERCAREGSRFKAPKRVQPEPRKSVDEIKAEFINHWQDALAERCERRRTRSSAREGKIAAAAGQVEPGVFIELMLAHERRHIWQAREVPTESRVPRMIGA